MEMNTVKGSWFGSAMSGMAAVVIVAAGGCAGVFGGGAVLTKAELDQRADASCIGIPEKTQKLGLLAYRDAFASATVLSEPYLVGKMTMRHTRGEVIAMRATPNVTRPWLGLVNSCHAALVESGRLAPSANDPFVVAGVTTAVEETYNGYVLSIKASSEDGSNEVVQRTGTLMVSGKNVAMTNRQVQ